MPPPSFAFPNAPLPRGTAHRGCPKSKPSCCRPAAQRTAAAQRASHPAAAPRHSAPLPCCPGAQHDGSARAQCSQRSALPPSKVPCAAAPEHHIPPSRRCAAAAVPPRSRLWRRGCSYSVPNAHSVSCRWCMSCDADGNTWRGGGSSARPERAEEYVWRPGL